MRPSDQIHGGEAEGEVLHLKLNERWYACTSSMMKAAACCAGHLRMPHRAASPRGQQSQRSGSRRAGHVWPPKWHCVRAIHLTEYSGCHTYEMSPCLPFQQPRPPYQALTHPIIRAQ